MTKLLIADDEPLVCVGVQSMLRWEDYDIEVVGTARNGAQAAEMIEELRPDIVISDIKMPLKTGLELARECGEKYGRLPLFIMLTSYEEFDLVRKAIAYQAVDYLIKLELDADTLAEAITKACAILQQEKRAQEHAIATPGSLQPLREKFFIRLFNNLFESEEQYNAQLEDLGLDLTAAGYAVGFFEIAGPAGAPPHGEKLAALCTGTVQMARETLAKYLPSYVVAMDMRHFSVVFRFEEAQMHDWQPLVQEACSRTAALLHNYFSVTLLGAVGSLVEQPRHLSASYYKARRAFPRAIEAEPLVFYQDTGDDAPEESYLIELRKDIRKAFEELEPSAVEAALGAVCEELLARPDRFTEAMDVASNILYMAFTLLPDSDTLLWEVFKNHPEGYRMLYGLNTVEQVVDWLRQLCEGCCQRLRDGRQSYKQQVVHAVQGYIQQNLGKKLTLNEVAAVFNFSPNYLSQLFAKHAETGFVEYITAARIAAAKEMLGRGEGKIYEIAERLGFESSFYFSKVFKKVEGLSPREYLQRLHGEAPTGQEELEEE